MPKKHNRVGAPTKSLADMKFPDNWKDIIFEMSANGCSDVEIRAALIMSGGLKAKTIEYMYRKLQEIDIEFSRTILIAKELCYAWWLKKSKDHLYHEKEMVFETGSWYANMKNRFGWRDKTEIETHEHKHLHVEFEKLQPDELTAEANRVQEELAGIGSLRPALS